MKLSDCEALEDSLRCICAELTPVSDTATAEQFDTDLDSLSSRHANTSTDIDIKIQQLEKMMKSWDDVRAGMKACSLSLNDAQQMLTDCQPQSQQDLQLESEKLKVCHCSCHSFVAAYLSTL